MRHISAALMAVPTACLLAWGGRRRAIALAAGLVSALAMPPFGIWPVLALTFPVVIWLLDGAVEHGEAARRSRWMSGFSVGWWFGFGYFLTGLWWIGSAFLVDGDRFAWMMPMAVVAMPIGLALFPAVALAFCARFWPEGPERVLVLTITLSLSEFVRGHVFTGFPWNLFGYAFGESLILTQSASVFGIYGLGLLTILICATPAILIDSVSRSRKMMMAGAALLLLGVMSAFGLLRLNVGEEPPLAMQDVRIVQPAIPQAEKWVPEQREPIFQSYLDLSSQPLPASARQGVPRMLVWPESALPFLLSASPDALIRISEMLGGTMSLATGAIRAEVGETGPKYFNSVYLLNPDGSIHDAYDKVHLVPFGEYLPLEKTLEDLGLRKLVNAPGAFEAGFRHRPLGLPGGISFLPLICYEAIFPSIAGVSKVRPDFLLNVTNDAWFGLTPGPYQHLQQSKMRAVEQGLPLVRAANTGVSAIIDAKGREVTRLELGRTGVLDASLPGKLDPTFYAEYGDTPYGLLLVVLFSLLSPKLHNPHSRKN
ncbi:apolipoprotein N-acyltransferase [Roseibium sp.]|uniref:apolipoprotein N-acyltransferase n=1 Tax=Roseibium sp. TaxID=1936156 RepID=UPI003A98357F